MAALASLCAGPAAVPCSVQRVAELPITMTGPRPIVATEINGMAAPFILDSGAFYSMMSAAAAAEYRLSLSPAPYGLRISGVGGLVYPQTTRVKRFVVAGVALQDVEFLVGGSSVGMGAKGLIGQNFLERFDVEYDFEHGALRLFRTAGCAHTDLAYWVATGHSYSVLPIDWGSPQAPHTQGTVLVNGVKVRAAFDSGAANSVLSLKIAAKAGVHPDSPGVMAVGAGHGIGSGTVNVYLGTFASFKVGDEEIKNARLRFADLNLDSFDMLIGADFFLSHRILVANSQHRLYFTYNGGPVFDLESKAAQPPQPAQAAPGAPREPPAADSSTAPDAPQEAADHARRGAAFASRHEFAQALAELTHACELDPGNGQYFYLRGRVQQQLRQFEPALRDLDRALGLAAADVPALLARAEVRFALHDLGGSLQDLDAVDRAAARQADVRLQLGQWYQALKRPDAALVQYDRWIEAHPADAELADALDRRCNLRALQGVGLDLALQDCTAALRHAVAASPLYARILGDRGLVRLRGGKFPAAIADYDAALKIQARDAWWLYGRGIAQLRMQRAVAGNADLAAARAIWPAITARFAELGISP